MPGLFSFRKNKKSSENDKHWKMIKARNEEFKRADKKRYTEFLINKGYTKEQLDKMDFGELMNTYDVHAKYLPRHKEESERELKLKTAMQKISYAKDEQQRILNNAKTYLKNRNDYNNYISDKDILFQADMHNRLRRLKDQQDVHDVEYMIGTMPSAPTTKVIGGKRTLKRKKSTRRNASRYSRKEKKSYKKNLKKHTRQNKKDGR